MESILTERSAITLAVFPFENLTLGNDLTIFCKSFSIDLITELSGFSQFQIIAYQTLENFKSTGNDNPSDFNQLHADYYIKGSFRSDKDRIRINAQLFESQTDRLVWANRFEGDMVSIQDIQENLHQELVSSLQQQLNYDLLSQVRRKSKIKVKAYEYWLYGMDQLKKGSLANDLKAREYFKQALELEPEYSLAHSGMSLSYFNEWSCQLWDRWDVSKSGASEWAQKAIQLDDQNYIAAMVLGKLFLFEESYETAEYYLRKSIQLNANDPETLISISAYFMYLGYKDEAVALYEKALRLNPVKSTTYMGIGAFIFFELGEYEKAASLVVYSANAGWADAEAYHAAIFYYLGDMNRMQLHWNEFLRHYQVKIRHNEVCSQQEAIEWLLKINPHKYTSHLDAFLAHISQGQFDKPVLSKRMLSEHDVAINSFYKENGTWKISFEGSILLLTEVKGFYDIRKLLAQPGYSIHCSELMGSVLDTPGESLIDDRARTVYRKKLTELQEGIEAAELINDWTSLASLQQQYDQLTEHLAASLGLKGRSRHTGSSVEKARSAVTWRIRNAIAKIELEHPTLGRHLSNAIKTGTVCRYSPEKNIQWITE